MNAMALGLIEVVGLPTAIAAADAAVKAANVSLVGYEKTKGGGLIVVKLRGEIGAVKAAVESGVAAAERIGKVFAHHVIARPAEGTDLLAGQVDRGPEAEPLTPDQIPDEAVPPSSSGTRRSASEKSEQPASARASQEVWHSPSAPDIPRNLAPNDHAPAAELAAGIAVGMLTAELVAEEETDEALEVTEGYVEEIAPDVEETPQEEASEALETTGILIEEVAPEAEEQLQEDTDFEEVSLAVEVEEFDETEVKQICNLCGDPECTRRKGQPHKRCIHR